MLRRLWATVLLCLLAATTLAVSTASADTGVIPDTPDLPWTHPTHESPLELLTSQIASSIAGRPVRVYCNGQSDWNALAQSVGFDSTWVWGYVGFFWYPTLGIYAQDATHTQLAPIACERLWQFAKATTKPTKCAAHRTTTESRQVTVRYQVIVKKRVRKRVRSKGKWVVRWVTVKQPVWRTRTETREQTRTVALDPQPCWGSSQPDVTLHPPQQGWAVYHEHVFAIQTLAHESVHLLDAVAGRTVGTVQQRESRAECFAMQLIPRVATELGAAPEDAVSLARYYAERVYPGRQSQAPDYWSADCRADGPLDASPGDGRWP